MWQDSTRSRGGNHLPASSRPRLVVFDCDGTLVDSAHLIIEAMSRAWRAHGLSTLPSDHAVRSVVGLNLVEAIARLLPEGGPSDHERLAEHYKAAFFDIRTRPDHDEPLYPGAREAIEALTGASVLLGVATGKSRRGLEATLGRHGLLDRFATLKTADDGPGKPAPAILVDAMAELGVEPRDTVMVGDTVYDVKMAINAGVTPLGVAWGYHESAALTAAGARSVVASFDRLHGELDTIWRNEPCVSQRS